MPIFGQNASIYGSSNVVSGQTYTYEASVNNASKYFWYVSGGQIINNYPLNSNKVSVVWDNNTTQGSIGFQAPIGQTNYQANLGVSIISPITFYTTLDYINNCIEIRNVGTACGDIQIYVVFDDGTESVFIENTCYNKYIKKCYYRKAVKRVCVKQVGIPTNIQCLGS